METQFRITPIISLLKVSVQNTLVRHSAAFRTSSIFFSPEQVYEIIIKSSQSQGSWYWWGFHQHAQTLRSRKNLTLMLNLELVHSSQVLPLYWNYMEVVMLPNAGKNLLTRVNHCPISLLNAINKIFEHLLLFKLQIYTMSLIRSVIQTVQY